MTTARAPRVLVYGALIIQTLLSAGTFLAAKRALVEVPPLALGMMRFGGASLCFALLVIAVRRSNALPPRAALGRVLLLGIVGVPLNQGLFLAGLSHTTPAHAALMYALTPLFVLVIALVLRTEKAELAKVTGIFLALAGAAIVVSERAGAELGAGGVQGDLMILGACLSWATYTVLGKPLVAAYGPIAATAWSLIAGTILFLPIGVPQVARVDVPALSTTFWATLAFLVLLTSVVSYLCWYYALRELEPSRVAVFSNLQPVMTALFSWAIFDERITGRLLAGGALVLTGVLVTTQLDGWRRALRERHG